MNFRQFSAAIRRASIRRFVSLALAFGFFGGCSPNWPPDYPGEFQPVAGRITLDGSPLAHVHVSFVPMREGGVLASAETGDDGRYRLSYYAAIGTPACEYRVVLSYRTDPKGVPVSKAMDSSLLMPLEVAQAVERLPERYATRDSVLRAIVKPGENVIDFALEGPLKPLGDSTP